MFIQVPTIRRHLPKWIKRIVANHYFYKWVKSKRDIDLNPYLIWSE